MTKTVNSSFHGEPSLDEWLDGQGIEQIYVCGITTNHCCETTARVGGNLGYDVRFVLDATHTFDRPDLSESSSPPRSSRGSPRRTCTASSPRSSTPPPRSGYSNPDQL